MTKLTKSNKLRDLLSEDMSYGKYKIAKNSERKKVVIIDWNSELGTKKFRESEYNSSFFLLAHNYVSQINPFYCGVACLTTVLNSFRVRKGLVPDNIEVNITKDNGKKIEYRFYNQLNVLNEETDLIKDREDIYPKKKDETFNPGLSLDNLKNILEHYFIEVDKNICENDSEEEINKFREKLKSVLSKKKNLMVLNFDGEVCGLSTGGHFSTVGAYNEEMDAVLILDSAGFKNPWFWVPTKHIYHAMNSQSSDGYRGYLILKDEFDEFLSL